MLSGERPDIQRFLDRDDLRGREIETDIFGHCDRPCVGNAIRPCESFELAGPHVLGATPSARLLDARAGFVPMIRLSPT
jgi:hypothetical protein